MSSPPLALIVSLPLPDREIVSAKLPVLRLANASILLTDQVPAWSSIELEKMEMVNPALAVMKLAVSSVSRPAPPSTLLAPLPASITSSPKPPKMVSLPEPVTRVSLPFPPSMLLAPSPAKT